MNSSFAQNRLRLHGAGPILAMAMIVFAGTAHTQSAATPELQLAQQAVSRASQADADHYAPELLASARQDLAQAQAAQDKRDKRTAQDLALRSAASADLARMRSQEAVATTELKARQDEVRRLKRELAAGGES